MARGSKWPSWSPKREYGWQAKPAAMGPLSKHLQLLLPQPLAAYRSHTYGHWSQQLTQYGNHTLKSLVSCHQTLSKVPPPPKWNPKMEAHAEKLSKHRPKPAQELETASSKWHSWKFTTHWHCARSLQPEKTYRHGWPGISEPHILDPSIEVVQPH